MPEADCFGNRKVPVGHLPCRPSPTPVLCAVIRYHCYEEVEIRQGVA